jgi:hypothetical protein
MASLTTDDLLSPLVSAAVASFASNASGSFTVSVFMAFPSGGIINLP